MDGDRRVLGPASLGLPLSGGARRGRELFIASRYLRPALLIGYDVDARAVTLESEIPTGEASWGMAVAGGALYLGQQGAAGLPNLYRMDLDRRHLEAVAHIDATDIWDLAAAPDGQVYGVAAGPFLFAFDPSSGLARVVGGVGGGVGLLRSVTAAGGEVVVGGRTEAGRALLRAIDPAAGTGRSVLPPALASHRLCYALTTVAPRRVAVGTDGPGGRDPAVAVVDLDHPGEAAVTPLAGETTVDTVAAAGGTVFATSRPSGRLWAVTAGAGPLPLGAPVPSSEHRALFALGARVVGVSAGTYLAGVAAAGGDAERISLTDAGVAPRPERPQSLGAGAGQVWAGGSFGISERALGTGDLRRAFVPGEPKDIAVAGGEAFFGLYPAGEVWRVRRGGEPARLASLAPDQNRPIALAASGRWVLVTAASDRAGGGSLTRIDRDTGTVDAVPEPFAGAPGQPPAGVTVHAGVAYVGGWGPDPRVAAYDVATLARRWEVAPPRPGSSSLIGLAVAAGRVLGFTPRGWLLVLDPRDGRLLHAERLPVAGGRLVVLDGAVYGAGPEALVRVDPDTLSWEIVADGLGAVYWNNAPLATDGEALYVLQGLDVLRVEPGG